MKNLLILPFILMSLVSASQIVFIPDTNFKNFLLADTIINTNKDGEIQITEASSSPRMNIVCINKNIKSVEGIQAFTNLVSFYCRENQIDSIDIEGMVNLRTLAADRNNISYIKLEKNLTDLGLRENKLTSIDISTLDSLRSFGISGNSIKILDISKNKLLNGVSATNCNLDSIKYCPSGYKNLVSFVVDSNNLTHIPINFNLWPIITNFICSKNQIKSLHIPGSLAGFATVVACADNQMTDLTFEDPGSINRLVVSGNNITTLQTDSMFDLVSFYSIGNPIKHLNLSNSKKLLVFYISSNELETINIQNDNNSSIIHFESENSPSLYCIQVDDTAYSKLNWRQVDSHTKFSPLCVIESDETISINEPINQHINLYPNPTSNQITLSGFYGQKKIRIINSLGETLFDQQVTSKEQLDISYLKPGLYSVLLGSNNELHSTILVKQ